MIVIDVNGPRIVPATTGRPDGKPLVWLGLAWLLLNERRRAA
jgi:hypothetical protein